MQERKPFVEDFRTPKANFNAETCKKEALKTKKQCMNIEQNAYRSESLSYLCKMGKAIDA